MSLHHWIKTNVEAEMFFGSHHFDLVSEAPEAIRDLDLRAPDLIEAFVGFKYLEVDPVGNLLSTPKFSTIWRPGERLQATCKPGIGAPPAWSKHRERNGKLNRDCPFKDCRCGIYAVRTLEQAESYRTPGRVGVRLKLWGRVIPASNGFRGQFAYPDAIQLDTRLTRKQLQGLQRYKVPLDWGSL